MLWIYRVTSTFKADALILQAAFHIFGMELLTQINLDGLCQFFLTFFKLPNSMWHGFMASTLTSVELLGFACLTFILAPPYIKARLITHIFAGKKQTFKHNRQSSPYCAWHAHKSMS